MQRLRHLHREIAAHEAGHLAVAFLNPATLAVRLHLDAEGWRVASEPPPKSVAEILNGLVAGGVSECLDQGITPASWDEVTAAARFSDLDDETLQSMISSGAVTAIDVDFAVESVAALLIANNGAVDIDLLHGCMETLPENHFSEWGKACLH